MYCKIIQEVYREPLGKIQLGKTKWKGAIFIEPLNGVEIFQVSVENPLREYKRYWRGLFHNP
jgi:hypothetical protein